MMFDLIEFPDPETQSNKDGLVCVGGELSVQTLLSAYMQGIFPWPQEGYPMLWFSPPERGVIDLKEFHIPKSLRKDFKKCELQFSMNQSFEQVIFECEKQKRPGQDGTWITPEVRKAYTEFHQAGFAYSIECWDQQKLVGGLYGVLIDQFCSAESMFYIQNNASKYCILYLIEFLRENKIDWLDIQMVTPVTESFGGKYITRKEFMQRLKNVIEISST